MKNSTIGLLLAGVILTGCEMGPKGNDNSPPGLTDNGRLQPCPSSPNCICTEYPGDTDHFREPVEMVITGDTAEQVESVVAGMGGTLNGRGDNYLAFTFTSRIFRFVDDFEVRLDPENDKLHIRSASRVGHGDFGVNRRRVARFKEALRDATP